MAYSKQIFSNGQKLKAEDLNIMSEGILEALGMHLPSLLKYQDNTQILDTNGVLQTATKSGTRAVMSNYLAVNKGDNIKLNNKDFKFIVYAYQSSNGDGYMGYVDTNPDDTTSSLENWGNDFTFTDTIDVAGTITNITYPLYIRLTFRHADGNSTFSYSEFVDSIEYNIEADNSHLYKTQSSGGSTGSTRVASPFLSANLISHRGLCGVAPENTLSAAQKAYEKGIKIIEMDIQMTKDMIPVLLHDTTINRTSNGSGSIRNMTYEQASQYDFGSWYSSEFKGEKLPKLEDFLIWCKVRGICPELDLATRGYTVEQKRVIYDLVERLGMLDSTLFTATPEELTDYLSFNPNIIVSVSGMTSLSVAQSILPNYINCGLVFPSIPVANLSKELVQYIHSMGMKAKVWTIDDTTKRDKALADGVDIILSDKLTTLY